jgi:hypothetical protein
MGSYQPSAVSFQLQLFAALMADGRKLNAESERQS